MKLSIFKVKKENNKIYLYFNSIEEMYEMYVHLLKEKVDYCDIRIVKETKDRRISQISGKYFSEFPKFEALISRKYENIIELPQDIFLISYDIKQYLGFHYVERKEFDHKKNGFSFIWTDWELHLNWGITGLKRLFYDIVHNNTSGDQYGTTLSFDFCCNSIEEFFDVYLYFLKLGYHTISFLFEEEQYRNYGYNQIERIKFKTTQLACTYENFRYRNIYIRLNKNFHHFLKFMEDFENLYWKMNYTFELSPVQDTNVISYRFNTETYNKLVNQKKINYGDII